MSIMSLGEPIAETGNLFAWGEKQIIKLYGVGVPEGWVEQLGQTERALFEVGLPVPEVGELIEIEGHLGQIYERIEGGSMADELLAAPEVESDRIVRLGELFAETHAKIHACDNAPKLLSQQHLLSTVIHRIEILPPDLKEATLNALDEMPKGDRLCHGDFHPYNVMMSPRGPIVIDWNNAHIGNPLEDVARSSLMLSGLLVSEPALDLLIDQFNQTYLERYFQLRLSDREQLLAWEPIVAAVRLSDDIPELQEWLFTLIKRGLAKH